MKKNIHPKYYTETIVTCACGHSFVTGSVLPEIKTELCSKCHPFYTGKQKLVDTARRVEKFQARVEKKKAAGMARSKALKYASKAAKRSEQTKKTFISSGNN